MITLDEREVTEVFVGPQGIKEILVGEDSIYERSGGYFYLTLVTT